MLKKTSIYLEEELDGRLAQRAAEEGISKAEFIRRTLSGAVAPPRRPKPSIGIFDSGKGDISANVDRYLAETGFGED
jgi:hypothetical protein